MPETIELAAAAVGDKLYETTYRSTNTERRWAESRQRVYADSGLLRASETIKPEPASFEIEEVGEISTVGAKLLIVKAGARRPRRFRRLPAGQSDGAVATDNSDYSRNRYWTSPRAAIQAAVDEIAAAHGRAVDEIDEARRHADELLADHREIRRMANVKLADLDLAPLN